MSISVRFESTMDACTRCKYTDAIIVNVLESAPYYTMLRMWRSPRGRARGKYHVIIRVSYIVSPPRAAVFVLQRISFCTLCRGARVPAVVRLRRERSKLTGRRGRRSRSSKSRVPETANEYIQYKRDRNWPSKRYTMLSNNKTHH